MSTGRALTSGLLAGLVAGIAITVVMLLLALFGVATPLAIIGDRLSVFIKPGPFLELMGRVGGYNHLKQLGVGSTMAGQLVFSMLGGAIFGLLMRNDPQRRVTKWTISMFIALPIIVFAILLWPVLGTSYIGLPIVSGGAVTLIGFAVCVLVFERTLVAGFHFLTQPKAETESGEFTPTIGRRSLILGGLGVLLAGGSVALLRKLYRAACFSYDGTEYKGPGVQPIVPNELFYCVTKNVIDPRIDIHLWHLEVSGLVQKPATYRFQDLKGFPIIEQETTLMCISNGLDAGLMSNAKWRGIALRDLIDRASPRPDAARVRLHAVDNYTDTFPLEKALEATTLIAFEMNGVPLPHRHGYPARVIVPGYFGEKNVKWLTRIELARADAKGFYESQGWGPDFIVPTRSRIDVPDNYATFSLGKLSAPIEIKGVAFGGNRGVSRVEFSDDSGQTWNEAEIYYSGGQLAWSLWRYKWKPEKTDYYTLVVRATDGKGRGQEWDEGRPPFSGVAGLHTIGVGVTA